MEHSYHKVTVLWGMTICKALYNNVHGIVNYILGPWAVVATYGEHGPCLHIEP